MPDAQLAGWRNALRRLHPAAGTWIRTRPSPVAGLAAACVAIAALSLLWPHTLTYDPWTWVRWGRQIVHGSLSTTGGTAWKPFPVIFDSVFSLFGNAAPDLWLVLARAGALMGLVLAYQLAARVAGWLGGILAVAWVVVSGHDGFLYGWFLFFGSGWSEGVLVALSLGALMAHLRGTPKAALWAWFAAALIRPEAAVFLLVYGVVVARRDPALRKLVATLFVAVPVLWVVPDYLGSGQLLGASKRALSEVPASLAHAKHPGLRDIALLHDLLSPVVLAGDVLALVLARGQARRLVLAVVGVALAWVAIVAVMAEAGYPGIPRFLVVSVALGCVAAGIGWACAVRLASRRAARLAAAAAVLAVNAVFLAGHATDLRRQVSGARDEARQNAQLADVLVRAGGAEAVRRCGPVRTDPLEIPALVWKLGDGSSVTYRRLRSGMIFSTRVSGRRRAFPGVPAPGSGFKLIAQAGRWSVYANCRVQPG
ncbi:MAG: hypothetical protein QOD66_6 [Solirubrobacteraceae bacterium]|jgi:hypothetical protein|nr:hypothetical protein [Solirubrobacteraceae bacterium]